MLRPADQYANEKAVSVVFFADLTRTLTLVGTSWAELSVDWEAALADLQGGPYASLYLTISERAYLLLCNPAVTVHVVDRKGVQQGNDERELVRQALTERLSMSSLTAVAVELVGPSVGWLPGDRHVQSRSSGRILIQPSWV